MDTEDALHFLAEHQPLPADDALSHELIDLYDAVRRHFVQHPDPRCIPLFLNSFGNGSGFGVYQVVDDVFLKHNPDQVLPHLQAALRSPHLGVRYWASQCAMDFPSPTLVPALKDLLRSNGPDNLGCHYFAVAALEQVWRQCSHVPVLEVLEQALSTIPEDDVRTLIQEILLSASRAV